MTNDIKELRRQVVSTDIVDHIDLHKNIKSILSELLDRLEEAEEERDNSNAAAAGIALQAETLQAEVETMRARIEEMEKQRAPEGYKLVPIEPTQEMSEAGVYAGGFYYDIVDAVYEAMVNIAPEAKP